MNDPAWTEIERSSDEDDAFRDLEQRLDRAADYTLAREPLQLDGNVLHRRDIPIRWWDA